jgi:hypothetical protein
MQPMDLQILQFSAILMPHLQDVVIGLRYFHHALLKLEVVHAGPG